MLARLQYYSGYSLAERKYGRGAGLVVAFVLITIVNVVCVQGAIIALLVCIRRRPCYFCLKDACPRLVGCLVRCGCGPADAERLNNEAVKRAGEGGELEMEPQRADA